MNIINIEHISKIFGEKTIFEDASFGIQEGDKIGIVGINGTGKTTLLRMIAGEEEPDEGQIIRQNQLKLAWLPQDPVFPEGATIRSFAGEDESDWRVQSHLSQLGITDYDVPLDTLSGGQKRKVALAKVLAGEFDVLLLDEPTNHLDAAMINWLEDYLKNYRGTVLMVTHDRYFLDKVTNQIMEISQGKIYGYASNYSGFLELKAAREESALASERKRRSILRMELEWAKRGCRARTTKQKARLERLEALKNGKAPMQEQNVAMDSVETRMGKKTIELRHISKAYGQRKLIDDYSYIFLKNQKVGIIGPNGCGKSTLMKLLAGEILPDSGTIEVGETIRIGYFAQEEQAMDDNQRVIDYVRDIGEYIVTREGRISASQLLERFLFTPEMQYSPVGKLSGGEKRRLYLLGVLCQNINVLLLDEASNSLDIPTLTVLEDYLNSFVGIVIAVSHDRYFLDNMADRILEFDGAGHICQYEGGYTEYLEAKERLAAGAGTGGRGELSAGAGAAGQTRDGRDGKRGAGQEKDGRDGKRAAGRAKDGADGSRAAAEKNAGEEKASVKTWKQNRPVKLKFTYNEQREFDSIDDDIAALEQKIKNLDDEMMKNATNSLRLGQLMAEKEEAELALEEKMERWVYLNDLAERIEAQKQEKLSGMGGGQ